MKTLPESRRQRGTVMLFGLIAMALLLLSAVALVRSFNASQFNAGNLAFKRDMTNQAELAWKRVAAQMQSGFLADPANRANHQIDYNYSATTLVQSGAKTIPDALLDDSSGFAQFYQVARLANDISVPDQAVTVRYVVDRLCSTTGLDSTLGADKCTLADGGAPSGGVNYELQNAQTSSSGGPSALPKQVVYRLSVRVTGPRNTQSFYQTTFSL